MSSERSGILARVLSIVAIAASARAQSPAAPPPVRTDPAARETVTLAFGPRFHFKVGASNWVRPGLSLTFPLDQPLSGQGYRMLQIDLPFTF